VKEDTMKTSIAVVASALAFLAAATAGGAGGPQYSPGLAAWTGVVDRGEGVRYVTLWGTSSTLVTAIRVQGGQPLRARPLRGYLGIPLVTYNGTAGGLSGNGKRLAVATYAPVPGQSGNTRFVVIDTKSMRTRRSVVLDGSWSFDAISPDGSTLFLTEHITAGKNPRYRVRSYDVRAGVLHGALVDRLENEQEMGGDPIARASSRDGRWAYTLYARRKDVPFVHALDTTKREAYCIGLPVRVAYNRQWGLRLRLEGSSLAVRNGRTSLATIDVASWEVRTDARRPEALLNVTGELESR
jgi:hypothetical protein